jgi:hypothetical protein
LKLSSLQHGALRTTSNIFRLTFEYTPLYISMGWTCIYGKCSIVVSIISLQ